MKYLKIILEPIKIKGDLEDEEQLKQDIYEKVMALVESETLNYYIDDEDEDAED